MQFSGSYSEGIHTCIQCNSHIAQNKPLVHVIFNNENMKFHLLCLKRFLKNEKFNMSREVRQVDENNIQFEDGRPSDVQKLKEIVDEFQKPTIIKLGDLNFEASTRVSTCAMCRGNIMPHTVRIRIGNNWRHLSCLMSSYEEVCLTGFGDKLRALDITPDEYEKQMNLVKLTKTKFD